MTISILKIVSVGDTQTASNSREFRKVTFKPVRFIGNLQVNSNQNPVTRLVWNEFKDEQGNLFKADQLFLDLRNGEVGVGSAIEGQIITFSTTEFLINGSTKPVTSYSMVIFSNEYEKAVSVANRALKSNNASVIDETGTVTCPENLKKESLVAGN